LFSLWNNGGTAQRIPIESDGPAEAQAQVNSLTVSFLQRAWADVVNLAKMIERAHAGDRSVYREIERICHSIHGAGAMFGFPKISEVGGAMARIVAAAAEKVAPDGFAGESVTRQQLLEANKQLAQEVEAAWQTAPQSAAMFQGPGGAK
jgi:chemotaxis protein histidine kinase CheA